MRHAIALAEELNFAKASRKLHLSQPALTRSIQMLEEKLGLLLFDRNNRKVALTTAGALFIERARQVLFRVQSLHHEVALLRTSQTGRVAFGVAPIVATALLPTLLRAIRHERASLQLATSCLPWQDLLRHLRDETIEFFIADISDIDGANDLSITPLCRQDVCLLVRPGHPLLAAKEPQPHAMTQYGYAALAMSLPLQELLRTTFGLAGNDALPLMVECSSMDALKELVYGGELILVATEASVARDIDAGRLVCLPLRRAPALFADIGVVELKGRTLSASARLVLDRLCQVSEAAPASAPWHNGAFHPTPSLVMKRA